MRHGVLVNVLLYLKLLNVKTENVLILKMELASSQVSLLVMQLVQPLNKLGIVLMENVLILEMEVANSTAKAGA